MERNALVSLIRRQARAMRSLGDVQAVLQQVAGAHTVLLGEASHGTHEFYAVRAEITRRLIVDHGFDAVAVESDWPDALRVNRWVKGGADADPLGGYLRFPRWMWRNAPVQDFTTWLRQHNAAIVDPLQRVGFYGLDLYSLRASMDAVVHYLDTHDAEAAERARRRYACFDHLADNPQRYGHALRFGLTEPCEHEVVHQLQEMLRDGAAALRSDPDDRFHAQQNARVVSNAEAYYRAAFQDYTDSWNLRDTHMMDTLQALRDHLRERLGRPPRIAVWAHNSHLGDARATEPAEHGQLNLGQLVRERWGDDGGVRLVGFTTHTGTVTAASDWDEPAELKTVRPSLEDSVERLLHDSGHPMFLLALEGAIAPALGVPRLERAIGVIYRPETERWSHYFYTSLSEQFDCVIHIDETRAVTPLDSSTAWVSREEPETFPSGM